MKKWTEKEPRADHLVNAEDFSAEYSQYKSVFNGGIDRTAMPADHIDKAQLKDNAFHKVTLFNVAENDNYIDSTNTPDAFEGFECQTFTSYKGVWYIAHTETITGLSEGWVHIEFGMNIYADQYYTTRAASPSLSTLSERNTFLKVLWNGEILAEHGPITKTMQTFRTACGTYSTGGTGTLQIYMRSTGPKDNDASVIKPVYHWWDLHGLVIARWR